MNSQQYAGELLEGLKKKEQLEDELKELNKGILSTCATLSEVMEDEDCGQIEIQGIVFKQTTEHDFSLAGDLKGSKWDEQPEFFEFLKKIGEGGAIQTKVTVPWNTRKKILKEYVAQGEALPAFIVEVFFETVKWNKSALKRLVESEVAPETRT